MRSVVLMAMHNLRRRKGQGILVGSIVGLSALLFFTGLGVIREIERPFRAMFEELQGSHLTMVFDGTVHPVDRAVRWWRERSEAVLVTPPMPVVTLHESTFYGGKELSRFLLVTERPPTLDAQDRLRFVAGKPAPYPGHGEVWVPTSLAQEAGMRVGETLEIPASEGLRSLRIAAVVVDPQYSGPFTNPTRVWVAPGELPYYFEINRLTEVMIGVRLRDPAASDRLWNEFVGELGGAYGGSVSDYPGVRDGYVRPYTMMAAILVAFSALGFLVALFAIQGTITSSILADFKIIGILRTQGFRPVEVRRIYQLQYLILAAIALPVGVLLGVVVVRETIGLLTRTIGTPVEAGAFVGLGLGVLLLFVGLVYGFVVRVTRVAAAVKPADAIRYGAEAQGRSGSVGISLSSIRRLSIPLMIAIKNLGLSRRRAAFLAVSVGFATMAASLAVNLNYSFEAMRTDLAPFGFDGAQVRVSRTGRRFGMRHEALMAALTSRADVRAVATWDPLDGTVWKPKTGYPETTMGIVVDGDMEGLRYGNLRGRNPAAAGEVSLAVVTARELGKDVGDTVRINILGVTLDLAVTGVFQSINNTGHGFRIRLDAVKVADPLWRPTQYGVVLAPGVAPDRFIDALESEYGEAVDAKPGDYFIRDQLDAILGGLRLANGFLASVFLLAASIFIVNTTLLSIAENRRTFGILKTTGMTPGQLRTSVVYGVGTLALIGTVAGLVLWFLVAPPALSAFFSQVGLVSFPLRHSVVGMAIAVGVILGFSLASAWVPSKQVLEVNPRALIVE